MVRLRDKVKKKPLRTRSSSLSKFEAARIDPSRTQALRTRFVADLSRRFDQVKRDVWALVVTDDAFGLAEPVQNVVANAGQWKFNTSAQKLELFKKWLAVKMAERLKVNEQDLKADQAWELYVQQAYQKGAGRAFDDAKKHEYTAVEEKSVQDFYRGKRSQFIESSFANPQSVEKVKLLAGRIMSDLKGVSEAMGAAMTRTLVDGFARGESPRVIGRQLAKDVDGIGKNRAATIARTEIIRAHAEGQLDALKSMGMDKVGVLVEWSVSHSGVCPLCQAMDGTLFKIDDAHGMIPKHPNCRCAFIPANVGEDMKGKTVYDPGTEGLGPQVPQITESPPEAFDDVTRAPRKPTSGLPGDPQSEGETSAQKSGGPGVSPVKESELEAQEKAQKLADLQKKADQAVAAKEKQRLGDFGELDHAVGWYEHEGAKAQAELDKQKKLKDLAYKAETDLYTRQEEGKFSEALKEAQHGHKWLKESEKLQKQAEDQAKAIADSVKKATKVVSATKEKDGGLPSLVDLDLVKTLPGSTRPSLMKNRYTGKEWVVKSTASGIKPDHLRSEALADELYRTMGFAVPKSGVVETPEGPAKVGEFVSGKTLQDWLYTSPGKARVTKAEMQRMYSKIQDGFVMDALMANHDVVGMNLDNVLVVNGKPFRIDNGGSMLFRAQGGAKQDFGPIVKELASMRDPSVNANTARVYAGLTQDRINQQIRDVVAKKELLLSKIDDPALRATMASRIDYLQSQVKETARLPQLLDVSDRAKARLAEEGVGQGSAERVIKSRANGVTFSGDRDKIEDTNILAWQETGPDGQPVTRLRFKVTESGDQAVKSAMRGAINAAAKSSPTPIAVSDPYYQTVLNFAKTVNKHVDDGKYNQATIDAAEETLAKIAAKISLATDTNSSDYKMLVHYKDHLTDIFAAKYDKKATGMVSQFQPPPPKADTPLPSGVSARVGEIVDSRARIENGFIFRGAGADKKQSGTTQYHFTLGDDADVKFVPWIKADPNRRSQNGLAYSGTVDVVVKGQATDENLQKAMGVVKTMGIDPAPPTPAFQELLYLHRNAYLTRDHESPEYKKIFSDQGLSDEAKVKAIKKWYKEEKKVDVDGPAYDPKGQSMTGAGDGYRRWRRFDITKEDLHRELLGYTLHHNVGSSLPEAIHGMLQSGGEATPTLDRLRKGVPTNAGASVDPDLKSGGSSYFFTRIKNSGSNAGPLRFKIDALLRQDAISYDSDHYGAVGEIEERKSKLEQYKKLGGSAYTGNETIFKGGLSLLDDLDHIQTKSSSERQKVLEVFKKNKITHLNDGRKIEEVVR